MISKFSFTDFNLYSKMLKLLAKKDAASDVEMLEKGVASSNKETGDKDDAEQKADSKPWVCLGPCVFTRRPSLYTTHGEEMAKTHSSCECGQNNQNSAAKCVRCNYDPERRRVKLVRSLENHEQEEHKKQHAVQKEVSTPSKTPRSTWNNHGRGTFLC